MSLENYLKNRIPFGEACAFLTEFNKLGEDIAAAPPAPDVASLMAAVVQNEFRSVLAYTVYAQTLRDLARESLAEEFQEHADEELEHAEFLLRRLAVLGGQPPLTDIPMPPPASDPVQIVTHLIQLEQESIAAWQALHASVGEDPTKYKIEEYLSAEQEHLDDLIRLLPEQPTATPPPVDAGTSLPPAPTNQPQKDDGGASVKVDLKPGGEKVGAVADYAIPAAAVLGMGALGTGGVLLGMGERGRKQINKEVHDPRLYSNLRGMFESDAERVAAHSKLPGRQDSVLAAMHHGFNRTKEAGFAERLLPGTESYYSDRMLSVLQGLPPKVFTPEGALDGVTNPNTTLSGEKLAAKHALAFKLAADEMMAAPNTGGNLPQVDPQTSAMLQNEMEGQEAQQQNEAEYYKQRFAEAQQQLEAATQASEQAAAQAQQLQQQAEQNQMALSSAQNQAQQATALAMQQVMQAGDEKLQQQMQAAQMRMAFQEMRGQLMNLASQEPPSQVLADPAAMGAPPAGQVAPGQAPPEAQPQDAASAPAGQAPDPQAPPGQPGPGGEQTANAGSEPSEAAGKGKGATSVTVKQGSFKDHALGAGLGAAIGGIGTAAEAGFGDEARATLKSRISQLEQEQGSFPQAMRLVASKGLLGASEAAAQHPVGATIMGSLVGAGIGASTEPAIRSLMKSGRRLLG